MSAWEVLISDKQVSFLDVQDSTSGNRIASYRRLSSLFFPLPEPLLVVVELVHRLQQCCAL